MFRGTHLKRVVAVVIGVFLLPTLSLVPAAGDAVQPDDVQPFSYTRFVNWVGYQKCLVVQGPSDGSLAFLYDCLPYDDQLWQLEPTGDGDYWIRNKNSLKCLVVQGDADGARAFQYTCLSDLKYIDQHWVKVPDLTGKGRGFQLRNSNSEKCLVAQGGVNNAPAFQYTCLDFDDQYWRHPGGF